MTSQLYTKEERMCLGDNLENYPPAQLSWQPPPVTKCGECCYLYHAGDGGYCAQALSDNEAYTAFTENKDGITPTCPMWQQQNPKLVLDKLLEGRERKPLTPADIGRQSFVEDFEQQNKEVK